MLERIFKMNLRKKHTPIFLRKITPLFRGEFCKFTLVPPEKCHSHESGNPVEMKDCGFPIKSETRKPYIIKELYSTYYDTPLPCLPVSLSPCLFVFLSFCLFIPSRSQAPSRSSRSHPPAG